MRGPQERSRIAQQSMVEFLLAAQHELSRHVPGLVDVRGEQARRVAPADDVGFHEGWEGYVDRGVRMVVGDAVW